MKITLINTIDKSPIKQGILGYHLVIFNKTIKRYFITLNDEVLYTYSYYTSSFNKYIKLWREYDK